ncbi:MAG TPA: carboxypeptidase-like regulatory domain-containing protein, partial [Cyclobacteriaceae bacterium]|nr:carboxypeptidase-like regulatory domain-containing protein [Cyclobacteriaceae bacterium]
MTKLYQWRKGLLFAVAFALISSSLCAQGVTTSSVSGQVLDESNESLPGASIVAIHNPTGTQYVTTTRSDGRFNLPNLRIGGPYTVTMTFIGYENRKADNVYLKLGENMNFTFVTKQSAQELAEVVVSASDLANKDKTGASVAFDNNQIRRMPTITRSAADIYRLTPSSDGNSFAGRNDQYNNFSLNGAIFNNPFGLDAATPGGQT